MFDTFHFSGLDIAALVAALGSLGGLYRTWRKNGREQKERDERMAEEIADRARKQAVRDTVIATNQKNILKRLDDPEQGLSAMVSMCHVMSQHCSEVSTSLTERVKAAERDISELKKRDG